MQINICENPIATAKAFAEYMLAWHKQHGAMNVALSGGSTPKILFDLLATDYAAAFDWTKINLYWGDERCVAPTDSDSNYKMTNEHLLAKVNIPEGNIHRVLGENDPEQEAIRYGQLIEQNLPKKDGNPVFDIIILGMGTDGHTASIFPHEIELLDSAKTCEVANHPETGQKRVTLTGPVLNQARSVCFLVTGDNKKEKIKQIFEEQDVAKSYPAYHINPKEGELIWFLDEAAASSYKKP
ncbi:6-phosphogluconolactonase [Roseivirga sp. UBA1976]|uniref:6-phosphogluconolactonase n=1 Tax=Roseivirga sp. UBA1976 TaxID=1947386 RepID=UPI00257A8010|nr:6-phosphogluconolactonase [Roseivirga sp. UBA1976]|tara:strand:+ start:2788 stop:3507 length:720 start_codon:yes stop_codon:yes gene_type:complete